MSEKKLILIIDDDYDTRTVVKTILCARGFATEDAAGGRVAIEWLKTNTPALIILDVTMPEMTGYEVATELKKNPLTETIPIVMLTAKGDPEDMINAYKDYAIDYYITKPFTPKQLLAGIKLVLGEED